jgi:hypothetical protein
MLLGARQFFERRGAPTPPLPYDYAVEYIETDGVASYIDTGITPILVDTGSGRSVVELSFAAQSLSHQKTICGASFDTSGVAFAFGLYCRITSSTNRIAFRCPNMVADSPIQPADSLVHDVSLADGTVVCDGVTYQPAVGVATQNPTSSFKMGWGGTSYGVSNARFYRCKIYTNNVLVFDGIPVVANGVAGIYDSISGTVKTNAAASGTITAGPRV